jgi:hypothetical protein
MADVREKREVINTERERERERERYLSKKTIMILIVW